MNVMLERLHGPVLRPGDEGFEEECTGYQLAHPHRPDVLVGATSADDVLTAVAYAGERGLPLAVQLSGHGRAVPLDGGVLVSTRRMAGVQIDPTGRTARIEAGVRWQQVVDAAAAHGLAPLSGSSPGVGAVGYTLGGGLGVLGRAYGWAADHVRSVEFVTRDARLRRTSPDAEPSLFTALRNGEGVVTAMEIGLVPVTRVYGGSLLVDGAHVPALLDAYRGWTATLPDALTSSVALIPFGRRVAHVRIAFDGSTAEGERLVAPLRDAVPLLEDTLGELPFTAADTIFNDPTEPHPYMGTNALISELDPAVLRSVAELAGPEAPVPVVAQLRHLGGALARPGAADLGAHRNAAHLVSVLSLVGGSGAEGPAHRKLMDAVGPWTLGRSPNAQFGPQQP